MPRKSNVETQLNWGGRKGELRFSGLLSDWSKDKDIIPSASLVSLIVEGGLHFSPHGRRLVPKGLFLSSVFSS